MSIKSVLDDAAAEATAGLRVDLAQAHRQAAARRARARRRASAMMASAVAVAALIALVAVLIPGGVFRAVAPAPASPVGPVGLPQSWYYVPPWTPPVTRHPMTAASMVLVAPMQPYWNLEHVSVPVLVSADGTSYASLPWSRWDGLVALAPSGRDVGWVSQAQGTAGGPKHAVVHRIRLRDGVRQDVELPSGDRVDRLLWVGDRLYLTGWDPARRLTIDFELAPGDSALSPGENLRPVPTPQQTSGDGTADPNGRPGPVSPAGPRGDAITSPLDVVFAPDGVRSATLVRRSVTGQEQAGKPAFSVLVSGGTGEEIPITGSDPIVDARILGWATGGIVVRIKTRETQYGHQRVSLLLVAPDGHGYAVPSQAGATFSFPVAVAVDVVGQGASIPVVAPQFSATDRSHVRFLIVQAWARYQRDFWFAVLLGLLGLTALVLSRRYRRAARRN